VTFWHRFQNVTCHWLLSANK